MPKDSNDTSHGKWLPYYREYGIKYTCCSKCGWVSPNQERFCPKCKAVMENGK